MNNLRKTLGLDNPKPRSSAQSESKPAGPRGVKSPHQPAEQTDKEPENFRGHKLHGRLPDGARFAVVYHASAERWRGTLTIGSTVLEGEHSGVFRLLAKLDQQYRASLGSDEACPPPA
jgi:hypothetical protein